MEDRQEKGLSSTEVNILWEDIYEREVLTTEELRLSWNMEKETDKWRLNYGCH